MVFFVLTLLMIRDSRFAKDTLLFLFLVWSDYFFTNPLCGVNDNSISSKSSSSSLSSTPSTPDLLGVSVGFPFVRSPTDAPASAVRAWLLRAARNPGLLIGVAPELNMDPPADPSIEEGDLGVLPNTLDIILIHLIRIMKVLVM